MNGLGHLSNARRMSSAVIAAQEQLLDIFPKIRIPGRAQGLNTVQDIMNFLDVKSSTNWSENLKRAVTVLT